MEHYTDAQTMTRREQKHLVWFTLAQSLSTLSHDNRTSTLR